MIRNDLRRGHERGFSIVELLAAVAISGILFMSAVPAFKSMQDSVARGQAVNQVEFDLRRLRTAAVAEGAIGIFAVDEDGGGYSAGFDYLPVGTPPSIDENNFSGELPSSVSISLSSQVYFDSRGFLVDEFGDPASVEVSLNSNGNLFGTIFISPTGALDFQAE